MDVTIDTSDFSAVQIGDQVWIPGTSTGDSASPFNSSNVGLWSVIGLAPGGTPKTITLTRPAGVGFAGVSESNVTPASADQFVAFSADGVQVGDTLEITAGFSPVTQTAFKITNVLPTFVEFASSLSFPLETGIQPDNAGMVFYYMNKKFLRIEVDQEAVLRFNGDTGNSCRLSPRVPGDRNNVGVFVKTGTTWGLEIVNRSRTTTMKVTCISAE